MDEKTAAIPSLKDFKEKQKERSAQSARTGSMQTKGQMKRNTAGQKQGAKNAPARTGSAVQRGGRSASDSGRPASGSTQRRTSRPVSQRPSDSARGNSARNTESPRRTSSSDVRTYASQRNATHENIRRTDNISQRGTTGRTGERRAVSSSAQSRRTSPDIKSRRTHTGDRQPQRKPAPKKPVKKAKKPLSPAMRKFRNFLIYLSIILIVVVVGGILSLTVLFKTNNINVNGLGGVYKEDEIISASGLTFGDNIFTAPKSRAEDRIEKKFPYIERADISSSFPDSINIDITLVTPACVVEGLGGFYIVSDKGKVLEVSATDDEAGVPIIEGVEVQGRAAGEYIEYGSDVINQTMKEIFSAFKEYDCKKITAINIKAEEDSFAIKYVYDNRIVVFLGLPEHISYKIQTADKIIKEKIDVGGSMIAGDLDVSMCFDTTKSYFNQYSLLAPQVTPDVEPTEVTEPEEYGQDFESSDY